MQWTHSNFSTRLKSIARFSIWMLACFALFQPCVQAQGSCDNGGQGEIFFCNDTGGDVVVSVSAVTDIWDENFDYVDPASNTGSGSYQYTFNPGQAVTISYSNDLSSFSFTLPSNNEGYALEFISDLNAIAAGLGYARYYVSFYLGADAEPDIRNQGLYLDLLDADYASGSTYACGNTGSDADLRIRLDQNGSLSIANYAGGLVPCATTIGITSNSTHTIWSLKQSGNPPNQHPFVSPPENLTLSDNGTNPVLSWNDWGSIAPNPRYSVDISFNGTSWTTGWLVTSSTTVTDFDTVDCYASPAAMNICQGNISALRTTYYRVRTKSQYPHNYQSTPSATVSLDPTYNYYFGKVGEEQITQAPANPFDTSGNQLEGDAASKVLLNANYPEPFNPVTEIAYSLPQALHVSLAVYDLTGKRVRTLVDAQQSAGQHQVTFDALNLPSGVYMYRIQAGAFSETRKMTLLK